MFRRELVISRHLETLQQHSNIGRTTSYSSLALQTNRLSLRTTNSTGKEEGANKALPLVKLVTSNKISLSEIVEQSAGPDTTYVGKFLIGRSLLPPICNSKGNALIVVLDDPDGRYAIPLTLYNYFSASLNPSHDPIPVGSILVVMNPWLTEIKEDSSTKSVISLRSDNPLHIVQLLDVANHRLVRNVTWKQPLPTIPNPAVMKESRPSTSSCSPSSDVTKHQQNAVKAEVEHYISRGEHDKALRCVEQAIEQNPQNAAELFRLSASAHLALGKLVEALQDIEQSLEIDPTNVGRKIDKAKLLYRLGKYQQCKNYMLPLVDGVSSSLRPDVERLFQKVMGRMKEAETGCYDLQQMTAEAQVDVTLRHAEYFAEHLLEVRTCDLSGRERGLFAKTKIRAGTLLIAQKAVAVLSDDQLEKMQEDSDGLANLGPLKLKYLGSVVAKKLTEQPDLGKLFYNLHAGERLNFFEEIDYDETKPVVEDRMLQILQRHMHFVEEIEAKVHVGFWLLPSFVNHTCVDVNCSEHTIGDFQFVRAIRDIELGESLAYQYIESTMPYEERQPAVRNLRGFACKCRLCKMESGESRKTRDKLAMLEHTFQTARDEIGTQLLNTGFNYEPISLEPIKKLLKKARELRPSSKQQLNLPAITLEAYLGSSYVTQRKYAHALPFLHSAFTAYYSLGLFSEAVEVAANVRRCYEGLRDMVSAQSWLDRVETMANLMLGTAELLEQLPD